MEDLTQALLARVQAQQESANRISQLQTLCGGEPAGWDTLGEVASDVELKALLWRGLRQWGELTAAWQGQRLFALDVAGMEEQVGGPRQTWVARHPSGLDTPAGSSSSADAASTCSGPVSALPSTPSIPQIATRSAGST
jgi:hypothetical protein